MNANALSVFASENSHDEFLLSTGMPQEQIDTLDEDIKDYIVNDVKNNADLSSLEYVDADFTNTIAPRVNQVLSGIKFYVQAFRSGSTVYIYPTYEFTTDKRPRGYDSFSFQLGNALLPYSYGGQLWYKDYTMSDWAMGSTLTANTQGFNGAEYSGYQLGSPDWNMKMKGATSIHANIGSGSDKRIIMSYMHNPNRGSYSISFSAGGVGISYSSASTIYTNASTVVLSY